MSDARLAELAAAVGLQLDWQDANGRPQRVDPEVQRGLLEALGYPAQSPQQIEQSLAALARLREDSANLGLLVGECGQPLEQSARPRRHPGRAGLRGRHADRPAPGRRRPPAGAGPQWLCAAVAGAAGMGGGDGAAELSVPGQPRPGSLASLGSGRPGLCPAPPRRRRPGRQRRPRGPAAQRRAAWRRRAGDQPAARPGRGQRTCLQPLLAVQPAVLQCPARRAGNHSRHGGGGTGDPSRRPGRGDGPPGEPGADRLDSGGGPAHAPAAPTPPRLHRARQSCATTSPNSAAKPARPCCTTAASRTLQAHLGAGPDWRRWPEPLRRPASRRWPRSAPITPRVDFRAFGQWLTQRCLQHAQRQAREAGMAIGLVADRRWAPMAAAARPGRGRKSCSPK
uniref:4-alpha-glucanotransferase n=1 Tax=Pseudomonas aeruginosa TaxID=287 RepID=A0A5E5QTF2_PSEAI|nr:hypothetical protein TUEID40_00364 [Pseudomonas aeruginosa]